MKIILTPTEIMTAATIGVMRQCKAIQKGLKDAHGLKDADSWEINIEGALGECVVAKYKNVYWQGCGNVGDCDVDDFDVRTTKRGDGRLILHRSDADERVYWLVTGSGGIYHVRGWIQGYHGKAAKYWTDPGTGRPAYFIPQSDLKM